ncbi:STAS-like domain-containing protein [Oleiagrimonas sp. C23AA]|uniref:STAS-like domain-containing protein n=1 Tax=Oleiagrimonas sp. C23AA TaxID=2719047 RepID=UPI0014205897|nr:STAS-like domain-containing protein [Oleiagrimonas sp. C23AA]NII09982.1 STAS-like domain-containing protein [Oleiagrimonas sp. C23AA]
MTSKIKIAADFSDVPSGRYPSDGDYNGERFRDEILVPKLKAGEVIDVELDGVEGYGSSFLEEAFGGLVRVHKFDPEFLTKHLHLIAHSGAAQRYKGLAESFIRSAMAANLRRRLR